MKGWQVAELASWDRGSCVGKGKGRAWGQPACPGKPWRCRSRGRGELGGRRLRVLGWRCEAAAGGRAISEAGALPAWHNQALPSP